MTFPARVAGRVSAWTAAELPWLAGLLRRPAAVAVVLVLLVAALVRDGVHADWLACGGDVVLTGALAARLLVLLRRRGQAGPGGLPRSVGEWWA